MKQIHDIWFPKEDTHFIDHIHMNGDYQRDTFQAAMSYVKEPKIFYDIGAHVGLWSMMAIKEGFKEINAYEPNPKTFECLKRNLTGKDGKYKTHLNNYGINEDDIYEYMQLVPHHADNSGAISLEEISYKALKDNDGKFVRVNHINDSEPIYSRIESYDIKSHETLVKIDTEGMEAQCVLGMDKILYALRPVVCVEQRTNENALYILQKMGMQIVQQVRKDYILTWNGDEN